MARMTKEEKKIYLENRLVEMQEYENNLKAKGYKFIVGVDEVGRGPLAGPVVTAALVMPDGFDILGVDDSKKLTEKKREELYDVILEKAVCYGIGIRDNEVIDQVNILEATKLAMADAIASADEMLRERCGKTIDFVLFDAMKIDAVEKPQMSLIKGDSKSLSIAAASIVAKVTRDRMMADYHGEYPWYGFDSNKGYGAKAHYEGLTAHGMTPIHRKSFLKKFLK